MMFFTDVLGDVYRKSDVLSMRYDRDKSTDGRLIYRAELDTTAMEVWVDDDTRAEIEQYAGDVRSVIVPTDGQYDLIVAAANSQLPSIRTPIIAWRVQGDRVKPVTAVGEAVGEDFSIISTRNGSIWRTGHPEGLLHRQWLKEVFKHRAGIDDMETGDIESGD